MCWEVAKVLSIFLFPNGKLSAVKHFFIALTHDGDDDEAGEMNCEGGGEEKQLLITLVNCQAAAFVLFAACDDAPRSEARERI